MSRKPKRPSRFTSIVAALAIVIVAGSFGISSAAATDEPAPDAVTSTASATSNPEAEKTPAKDTTPSEEPSIQLAPKEESKTPKKIVEYEEPATTPVPQLTDTTDSPETPAEVEPDEPEQTETEQSAQFECRDGFATVSTSANFYGEGSLYEIFNNGAVQSTETFAGAFSVREVLDDDQGTWRVVLTDGNTNKETSFDGVYLPCDVDPIDTDTDGDGVDGDDVGDPDQCPNTPANEPVDANGCSDSQLDPTLGDEDGDGVPGDAIGFPDYCPNTPAGTPVDEYGCPTVQEGDLVIEECPLRVTNGRESDMKFSYGSFYNPEPDGTVVVKAGTTEPVPYSKTNLDYVAEWEDGASTGDSVVVDQECGDDGDGNGDPVTPTHPAKPDGGVGKPIWASANPRPKSDVVVPTGSVLPSTGGGDVTAEDGSSLVLPFGAGLAALVVVGAATRRRNNAAA